MHTDDGSTPLDAQLLEAACVGRIIRKICVFEKISSTNAVALAWGEQGDPEGCVAIAESQDAGRGQFGKDWHSAAYRGIWCSLLLRPSFPSAQLTCLTPLAVLAVAFSIRCSLGLEMTVKPPNDLYLSRGKACGLLTEARTGKNLFAVIGIGINVNQRRSDFPASLQGIATSFREETGSIYDRTQIVLAILSALDCLYTRLVSHAFEIQSLYQNWPRWKGHLSC